MKRPDGWDELYLEAYKKEHSGEGHGSPERAMFEAGADAYEKELRKERVVLKLGNEIIHTTGYILILLPEEVE